MKTIKHITWKPKCEDPTCPGWGHFDNPEGRDIQRCDECARFRWDEGAIRAHRKECGCDWPERAE